MESINSKTNVKSYDPIPKMKPEQPNQTEEQ